PVLSHFPNLYIPDLNSLVRACCDKFFRVPRPGNAEDTPLVFTISDLAFWLPCLAVIQPDSPVSTNTDEVGAVRTKSDAVDEVGVISSKRCIVLERRPVKKYCGHVVTPGCGPQGPLL